MNPSIQYIPLNQLILSAQNVRKIPTSASEQAELKASIQAHGLLENLVVQPASSSEVTSSSYSSLDVMESVTASVFEVLAGGRRLAALQELAREGVITPDFPVPCLIREEDASELSLAENLVRVSMHPIDQYEAFARLTEQGCSLEQIAVRFGCAEKLVKQRLKLGQTAPELRAAYRAGEISLEALMAFTITDDPAAQIAVWDALSGGHISAYRVRQMLTEGAVPGHTQIVRFVGVEAYEAAGGAITRDLFSEGDEGIYLDDRALVLRLAQEKLDVIAEEIQSKEGWAWILAQPEFDWEETQSYQRVYPKRRELTSEEEAEYAELDAYIAHNSDAESEEDRFDLAQAQARLDVIGESLTAYEPEDLVRAGCLVSVGYDGEVSIQRGMVRPQDWQASVEHHTQTSAIKPFSQSLMQDLACTRVAVVQSHLAQDFDCAFDLMLFTLARSVLYGHGRPIQERSLDISAKVTLPLEWPELYGIPNIPTLPGEAMAWMDLDDVGAFAALSALEPALKQQLFAYCVACTLQGGLTSLHKPLFEGVGTRLGVDMAVQWRPKAAQFWKRVSKAKALEIASDVLGENWATIHKDDKKAALGEQLEMIFAGHRPPGISAEVADAASRWVPEGMGFEGSEPGTLDLDVDEQVVDPGEELKESSDSGGIEPTAELFTQELHIPVEPGGDVKGAQKAPSQHCNGHARHQVRVLQNSDRLAIVHAEVKPKGIVGKMNQEAVEELPPAFRHLAAAE